MKIINPLDILQSDTPLFVLSTDLRGFMGFGIRARTNSNYNHIMIMHKPDFLASQGLFYKEIPMHKFMKPGTYMKFWKCKDITDEERMYILSGVEKDLKDPWWKRFYDYVGVLGSAIGLRNFNIPFLNYCSERVRKRIKIIIPDIQEHPSPADINRLFKENERMEVYGYYISD